MSHILEATFDGEVFRPTKVVELQPNTRVQLIVTETPPIEDKPTSFLRVARSLRLSGPVDWSDRLDDYLYGGAKFGDE